MRVLVLGAYGLIGRYVVARLAQDGREVVGLGRDLRRAGPGLAVSRWIEGDVAAMSAQAWDAALDGVEAVVNCTGLLQDGPGARLTEVHIAAVEALGQACVRRRVRRLVQISAAGTADGESAFSRTKREGEARLQALDLDWLILRPGLVWAPAAYGGSALLRGLAGFSGLVPAVDSSVVVQVIGVDDLSLAVSRALEPAAPSRTVIDLVAEEETTLREILSEIRAWLGFTKGGVVDLPLWVGRAVGRAADALAWLGWRSPLRSMAIQQMAGGVRGVARDSEALGLRVRPLSEILKAWPCSVQERWFARLYFLKPAGLITLALFWLTSGAIGLARLDQAKSLLVDGGMAPSLAAAAVVAGSLLDIALGLAVCFARWAPAALKMMFAVILAYLLGSILWRPDLWMDPLGPMVKTMPILVLVACLSMMMDDR